MHPLLSCAHFACLPSTPWPAPSASPSHMSMPLPPLCFTACHGAGAKEACLKCASPKWALQSLAGGGSGRRAEQRWEVPPGWAGCSKGQIQLADWACPALGCCCSLGCGFVLCCLTSAVLLHQGGNAAGSAALPASPPWSGAQGSAAEMSRDHLRKSLRGGGRLAEGDVFYSGWRGQQSCDQQLGKEAETSKEGR